MCGWQIWKGPHIIEAEFHCVWEDLRGNLHDITPKSQTGLTEILFLEDESIKYNNKQRDNVRVNFTKNEIVDHLISVLELDFVIKNKGKLSELYGDDFNRAISDSYKNKIIQVQSLIGQVYSLIAAGKTHKDLCFCGKKKSYINCHGKNFISKIREKRYRNQLIEAWQNNL